MPENAKSQLYEFSGFRLDPLRCRLYGADGEAITLKPKVFETLLYLVEHPGELLDKNTLMKGIWGNAVVEENSLNKHISTLRHVLGETPGENRYIVTVPGRGYRFVASVRTEIRAESESPDARAGSVGATRETPGSRPSSWLNRWYVLAGVASAALMLVIAWSIRSPNTQTNAQWIAVLPFDNLSAADDEYFADGISVELTELLTKIPSLHVIGRESAFWFKGKEATYTEIGGALGVTHLLDGTVRVAGDQVRVTASLIDPSTGEQIWSYSPEARPMADVFAIQEEIAADVVEQLRITLAGAVPMLDETTPEVHSLYLQASHILRSGLRESVPLALEQLRKAVDLDDDYLPARILLSVAYRQLGNPGAGQIELAEAQRLQRRTIEEAASIWPDRIEIKALRGFMAADIADLATSARYLEAALAQDPRFLDAMILSEGLLVLLGRPEQAIAVGEQVVARDPLCSFCYTNLIRSYFEARRFGEAVEVAQKAEALGLGIRPNPWYGASLLFSGDAEAALTEFQHEGVPPFVRLAGSAMAFHDLDRTQEFETAMAALKELAAQPRGIVGSWVYAYIGDKDTAFEYLNSVPIPNDDVAAVLANPYFDALRDDPRWDALARRWPEDPREQIPFSIELPE